VYAHACAGSEVHQLLSLSVTAHLKANKIVASQKPASTYAQSTASIYRKGDCQDITSGTTIAKAIKRPCLWALE
jgi:hypothetical protein